MAVSYMSRLMCVMMFLLLMLGGQQIAAADKCMDAWYKSSASKSCRVVSSEITKNEKTGKEQCYVNARCSRYIGENSYPTSGYYEPSNVPKLENIEGELKVGN